MPRIATIATAAAGISPQNRQNQVEIRAEAPATTLAMIPMIRPIHRIDLTRPVA